jgi:hypothetical protein
MKKGRKMLTKLKEKAAPNWDKEIRIRFRLACFMRSEELSPLEKDNLDAGRRTKQILTYQDRLSNERSRGEGRVRIQVRSH